MKTMRTYRMVALLAAALGSLWALADPGVSRADDDKTYWSCTCEMEGNRPNYRGRTCSSWEFTARWECNRQVRAATRRPGQRVPRLLRPGHRAALRRLSAGSRCGRPIGSRRDDDRHLTTGPSRRREGTHRLAVLLCAALMGTLPGCADRSPPGEAATTSRRDATRPTREAGAWPELPRTRTSAQELVRERSLRARHGIDQDDLTAGALLRRLSPEADLDSLVVGERRVTAWIQEFLDRAARDGRDAYVLWGSYHDAPGQIASFRRLVGPGGLRGLTLVTAEQFLSDGAWGGVAADLQLGDDADIEAYVERGDLAAFDALARRHRLGDHAAWKFRYEAEVLDLLVAARATGTSFAGCNMPLPLQDLVTGADAADDAPRPTLHELRALRELHCLASSSRFPAPRRMAMLWGRDHVRPDGFPRFLAPSAAVLSVYVLGFRSGKATTERELRSSLVLLDPVLVPLDDDGREVALLFPDDVLGGDVDRAANVFPGGIVTPPGATFACSVEGRMVVGGRTGQIGPEDRDIDLAEGDHTLLVEAGGLRLIGSIRLHRKTWLRLWFDPTERYVNLVELTERQGAEVP